MNANKIIVTGANGQLGSELRALAPSYPQYEFVFLGREEFSIADEAAVKQLFSLHKPAFLINCAAYTAVDKAESEKEQANEINGKATGILAAVCRQFNTRFLHISTDYVFNGNSNQPLKETDAVDPVNAYGYSKLLGEQLALKENPDSIIIRTAWVYSSYGKNFVKTMMRLMREKEEISVVSDQYGAPTYAADLAEAIMHIISSGKWEAGIYNYSNEGKISWFDFATEIRNLLKSNCRVHPIATAQYPTPAKRPHYSVLDKSKLRHTYGVTIRDWKESLGHCMDLLLVNS